MIKKGMAVPIVLIFATIMGVVSLYLLKTTKNINSQIETSNEQLQSYLIARAGVEHAMLKIKFLNRELYDAVCISQGRSPLFNYKDVDPSSIQDSICIANPGPVFLYKQGSFSSQVDGFFTKLSPSSNKKYFKWLDGFKEDLTSVYNSELGINKFLDMSDDSYLSDIPNTPSSVKNLKQLLKNTIGKSQYSLTDISMHASEVKQKGEGLTRKIDNHMVIQFTIESVYNSKKYNSSYNYKITRTAKISRE